MNIKLILKGVLLYVTFAFIMLVIGGIDSIYDKGYFIEAVSLSILLGYLCKRYITEEEADILLLNKFLNKKKI